MHTIGDVKFVLEGKEITVVWRVMQFYHETVVNKSKGGLELNADDTELMDKLHSALWHLSCANNLKEKNQRQV